MRATIVAVARLLPGRVLRAGARRLTRSSNGRTVCRACEGTHSAIRYSANQIRAAFRAGPGPYDRRPTEAMSTLGVGIVGVGKHGLRYVRHLTEDVRGAALV